MTMKCGICSRAWPDEKCHVITLTKEERAAIAATGQPVPEQYVYCKPCWKILGDRNQGAQLISGMLRATARDQGHEGSVEVGRKAFDFLITRTKKPVS